MPFLLTYIHVRTVKFFRPLNSDWSIQIFRAPIACKFKVVRSNPDRARSVVDELVWSALVGARGVGKEWRMMNNDFIVHVNGRNYLFFSIVCIT